MLQDATTKTIDAGQSAYMTITTVQHEVGIGRGTLNKYLAYWALSRFAFLLARAASPFRKKRWPG
jgi:response regulator of citrate/malate metabolism